MILAIVGSRSLNINITGFVPQGVKAIVSGGALGIDTAAENFAREHNLPIRIFKPNYFAFGKIAPILRNKQIVKAADRILAIWDGKSKGTFHTIKFSYILKKPITIFVICDQYVKK
ncbi:MAG: hypothetical protein LBK29_00700 [Oscillospiraceae bacterium]|jgi:hypothetical protein|nr:hypothetical protein [Oscillospiraceae bacterium]